MGKITILGLGPSVDLYKPDGSITIGVNDIWRVIKTDYIVCVDDVSRFTPDRLKTINDSKPKKFYSQLDCWSSRSDFEKIELQPYYPKHVCQLDLKQLPKSHCSPFVAACLAWNYFKPDEIHVYGVDLVNHPHLKKHSLYNIKLHFHNLKVALRQKGCEMVIHGNGILVANLHN